MLTDDRKAVCWAVPSRRSVQWNPRQPPVRGRPRALWEPRGTLVLSATSAPSSRDMQPCPPEQGMA
jgi:hypothetical protein